VNLKILREGNSTLYEAAIPLAELKPLAPDLWPRIACNLVLNDHDGTEESQRKGRLELREGAMTRSKNTKEFAVFEFEPSPDSEKVSAALFWRRRATPENGFFRLVVAASSPVAKSCRMQAVLHSLDSPNTEPVFANQKLPLAAEPREWSLKAETDSPPGRYSLDVRVEDRAGRLVTSDRLPVFVYPN
jgi:hypothetical protein